ncbi:MAG: class I SAM-dependent methyltransferase [Caldilineaceae bacterium]|nr:class I SAM-dependent methyltransferase [Caldilineaceae bacterium]
MSKRIRSNPSIPLLAGSAKPFSSPSATPPALSIEEVYRDPDLPFAEIEQILETSLHPRPSTMLYDVMRSLGLAENHRLLDVGCRDAKHTIALVQQSGCRAVGIDPVDDHISRALEQIAEANLQDRLTVYKGKIEVLPSQNARFDYIWCRDMLNHVPDLYTGLAECFRVLRPGGKMLIYQTFATNLLEPAEAVRLYLPLAIVAANMSHDYVEQILQRVGFRIERKDLIGSEWREYWEEDGTRTTSTQLLHLARLRRNRDAYIAQIGQTAYEVELADCHWGVYQMLGKLCPTMYVLVKPHSS